MRQLSAQEIAGRILSMAAENDRLLVAIAGPPGAGKTTLSEELISRVNADAPGCAALMPMDGYHYDNRILQTRGLLDRKGAPETFNACGLLSDLRRVKACKHDVAIPLFDRREDLARANAAIISTSHKAVIVEGNYLLLDQPVWSEIAALFDLTIWLSVNEPKLERRLIERWLEHGFDPSYAERRARENDMKNVRTVIAQSQQADIIFKNS